MHIKAVALTRNCSSERRPLVGKSRVLIAVMLRAATHSPGLCRKFG